MRNSGKDVQRAFTSYLSFFLKLFQPANIFTPSEENTKKDMAKDRFLKEISVNLYSKRMDYLSEFIYLRFLGLEFILSFHFINVLLWIEVINSSNWFFYRFVFFL